MRQAEENGVSEVLDPAAERNRGAQVRQHNRLGENPHDAAVGADRSAVDKHVNCVGLLYDEKRRHDHTR
jgi:hypothetical protein